MDYAKANPGVITAGHSGAGGGWHLALASIAVREGVKFNYVGQSTDLRHEAY